MLKQESFVGGPASNLATLTISVYVQRMIHYWDNVMDCYDRRLKESSKAPGATPHPPWEPEMSQEAVNRTYEQV